MLKIIQITIWLENHSECSTETKASVHKVTGSNAFNAAIPQQKTRNNLHSYQQGMTE